MNGTCSKGKVLFKRATHVIFDLDGLLLDTEQLYTKAVQKIVSKYDKTFDWSIKVQVMGLTGIEAAKKLVELLDLPISWEEYYELAQEQYAIIMPEAQLMPGAERLVRHLHKSRVPIAVATSSGKDSFDLKTAKYKELFSLFNHTVTGGSDAEVKQGKPHPDIFRICAQRFKDSPPPSPGQCLVFEDAPNGVIAAVAAGMQVVLVPDKQMSLDIGKDATLTVESLEKVRPELFGLPAFEDSIQ